MASRKKSTKVKRDEYFVPAQVIYSPEEIAGFTAYGRAQRDKRESEKTSVAIFLARHKTKYFLETDFLRADDLDDLFQDFSCWEIKFLRTNSHSFRERLLEIDLGMKKHRFPWFKDTQSNKSTPCITGLGEENDN
jgi:hypothetical protein